MRFFRHKIIIKTIVGGGCLLLAAVVVILLLHYKTQKGLVNPDESSAVITSVSNSAVLTTSPIEATKSTSSAPSMPTSSVTKTTTSTATVTTSITVEKENIKLARQDRERANQLAKQYYQDFFNKEKQGLLFNVPNTRGLATAWEYSALMSMQAAMAKLDKQEIPLMNIVFKGMDFYGYANSDGNLWGYVVRRGMSVMGATDKGLAYDDNIWIAINYIHGYEVSGNQEYLKRAEYLMRFILEDGWFEPLGGIFWDTRHEARHSCSNNPAIKPLVDLYLYTKDSYYLEWAKKVYDFSVKNLKNKKLNIYEDLIRAHQDSNGVWIEGNSANTGFYSYNTGSMISGASALYGVTGDKKYLEEALSCAKGAFDYFGNAEEEAGYIGFSSTSTIWFNCILLRGYIDLSPYAGKQAAHYIQAFQDSMDYGFDQYYRDGYMPYNWLKGWGTSDRDRYKESLDHSSNIEMYAMLSDYYSKQ